jgi:hypothetical protein
MPLESILSPMPISLHREAFKMDLKAIDGLLKKVYYFI